MDKTKLDMACAKMDSLVKRFDAQSPGMRKRSGFGTKSMRELDAKHEQALKPLLEARDKTPRGSPERGGAQKKVDELMDKQNREMLELQARIEKGGEK